MSLLLDKVEYIRRLLVENPGISNAEIYQVYGPSIAQLPFPPETVLPWPDHDPDYGDFPIDDLIESARKELQDELNHQH